MWESALVLSELNLGTVVLWTLLKESNWCNKVSQSKFKLCLPVLQDLPWVLEDLLVQLSQWAPEKEVFVLLKQTWGNNTRLWFQKTLHLLDNTQIIFICIYQHLFVIEAISCFHLQKFQTGPQSAILLCMVIKRVFLAVHPWKPCFLFLKTTVASWWLESKTFCTTSGKFPLVTLCHILHNYRDTVNISFSCFLFSHSEGAYLWSWYTGVSWH